MKKVLKMFSAVIILVLLSQTAIARSTSTFAWTPSAGLSATTCGSPCTVNAGADKNICTCCGPSCVTIGGSPHSSSPYNPNCPGGTITYAWAPGGATTEQVSVCPTTTTTYTLTVTFPIPCSCDPNCSATISDFVTVTVACNCTPCKIINPLFDPNVSSYCSNMLPAFDEAYFVLNILSNTNGNSETNTNLITKGIRLEIADKPKAPIMI